MKISKEEKEVMKVLEELVSSTLADSDGCLLFKTDYDEPLEAIHKIYKPLLDDLKAENDRLKKENEEQCNGCDGCNETYHNKALADKDKKIKGLEATVKQYSEYLD